jgi:glutamate/tyrosine decarboxylase-like PLP-dependent enzyme
MANDLPFETLDPADWDEFRQLAHRVIDEEIDRLRSVRERPPWQPMPPGHEARFETPAPADPAPLEEVYDDYARLVRPWPMGNTHPRFWAWYMGNGTPGGALAEFVAAMHNSNMGGGSHAAMLLEAQVIRWIRDLVGFPETTGGLLVSGGSMANLTALAVARQRMAGFDVREAGMNDAPRLVVYASREVHSSVQKALELMGMGARSLRKVAVDPGYRVDIAALEAEIARDRQAGRMPVAVVGNAGTINTGAIDDLGALADLCAAEGLWFHVDGAIGAVAMLSEQARPLLRGMERADSVALDLHKWLHVPFEAGCVLVREREVQAQTFSLVPEYLAREERGLAGGTEWFSDLGVQLSRQFRALKVWMTFREHGTARLGRMMDRNIDQARRLGAWAEAEPNVELLAPVGLDIVCLRYNPGSLDEAALNALNNELMLRLQERGIAVPSYTTLGGRYCLRVAIGNHRARDDDFLAFQRAVLEIGAELA